MFKLNPGDKIGIITPSNFLDFQTPLDPELKKSLAKNRGINPKDAAQLAIEYLRSLGLQVVIGAHVYDKFRHMGGTPQNRAEDLNNFIRDKEIKAIFCSTGGAGAQYMLPYIDYETLRHNPKPIFGISDASTLQIAMQSLSNNPGYNGFSLAYDFRYGKIRPQAAIDLPDIFSGNYHSIQGGETVHSGIAEGILVGVALKIQIYCDKSLLQQVVRIIDISAGFLKVQLENRVTIPVEEMFECRCISAQNPLDQLLIGSYDVVF